MSYGFSVGEHVRLLPFEGQPEEYGTIVGLDLDTCVVRLDKKYITPEDRDGLRDVPVDQLEPDFRREDAEIDAIKKLGGWA